MPEFYKRNKSIDCCKGIRAQTCLKEEGFITKRRGGSRDLRQEDNYAGINIDYKIIFLDSVKDKQES